MTLTIVEYYGEQNRSRCGYCKEIRSSFSHGMHAYGMSVQDYQDLIDRGWRRSGKYCYKPNNKITCCPCYTIKCDVSEFKLTKSQKKILKRMNKFLKDGIKDKTEYMAVTHDENTEKDVREEPESSNIEKKDINVEEIQKIKQESVNFSDMATKRLKSDRKSDLQCNDPESTAVVSNVNTQPCKKAKQIRIERKKAKLESKGIKIDVPIAKKIQNKEKSFDDFINATSESDCHKLKILLVPSHKGFTVQVLDLFRKYQVKIHNDPPHKITKSQFESFLCNTPLKLKLVEVNSAEFLNSLEASYGLYEKYQTIIHNDPPDNVVDYLDFLQRSPLKHDAPQDGPSDGYGSFHQQYWLDDKLIAVGVIDILPHCFSSVYFFYDPDYSFLSLGTYGSLREVNFLIQLSYTIPALKYYYMGFYIHSCIKMKYKAQLTPSFLLCPEKYTWHLLTDEIKLRLDEAKYQVFNTEINSRDENEFTVEDLNSVLILWKKNTFNRYEEFKQLKNSDYDDEILEYGSLVGKTSAHRMLYVKF